MTPRAETQWPVKNAPCCYGSYGSCGCVCTDMERAVRAWSGGADMPAMTAEQRTHCLDEIGRVEGYVRGEYESLADRDVASGVLSAWTDYCRDKGLL